MNTKMSLFSSRENLNKSQNVKLKITLKNYNIFNDIVIAQQSLPSQKMQQYYPSVNVSKKFKQTLPQKCRKKRKQANLKMLAIENVSVARNEIQNPVEKINENVVKMRRERHTSENNEITGVRNNRRASELVDQLLLDIYGRTSYSSGKIFDTEYGSSTSFKSVTEKFDENMQYGRLILKNTAELHVLIGALRERVTYAGNLLVKQLKKREALGSKQEKLCNVITAHLQAFSSKRSEDTNMRFSPTPVPGDSGFTQWRDAMKMVAKLPGGIPPEFRKKLWLALAEKHLQSKGVNWSQTERLCFNEWSNPDDNELGVQIVKDLHRTGCSLFCGAAGQENQALLKRVLLAYARWNKSVGYCQGFNMLAALILQVMDKSEIDSVKVMIYLIEGVLPESYFANNLRGLSVDMVVFRDLLRMRLPQLSKHLEALQNDAREGNSYEPPLTNVFTMQWFLTLFCNCLPQSTVLRVWDLIFLEGNEILLRTAIAIWEKLSDRILAVNSADEFYSIMGVLTREMLEFGLVDSNTLVKSIVAIGACAELNDMRDRYLYNITPWTQSVQTAAKKGFKLFYSDDDDAESDNDEKAAVTAVYGMSVGKKKERTTSGNVIQPYAHGHPDRERLALDISALKKQYAKLRERQRQAHIILQAACARQPMGQNTTAPPIAMNHLLLGKNAIVNARGRRLGPPKGAIPPLRTREPMKKQQQGDTIHWKDTAKLRYPRRSSYVEESEDSKETFAPDSDSSSYSEDDSSSTSTELCDEPERLSDFDLDDKCTQIEHRPFVDTVRTSKQLKNTINSEFLADESEDLNKSVASICANSELIVQDNEETVKDDENVCSEFKPNAVNTENVAQCFTESKSTKNKLDSIISESIINISDIESDVFTNPVFYSELRNMSVSEENYTANSTVINEYDTKTQPAKYELDNIEENQEHMISSSKDAEFDVYKFEHVKRPDESKICEDITFEENMVSSDVSNEIAPETKPETNYFNNSPLKSTNFEASSKRAETVVSSTFKLEDQKHVFREHLEEKIVPEFKEHETPMYNFESPQNIEISSQIFNSDRKCVDTAISNTINDVNEEIEYSKNAELGNKYINIELAPEEEESILRITSSEKTVKIQAMLNENNDILKGYQISAEEKRNTEIKSQETNDQSQRTDNYLLDFDSNETDAVLISKNTSIASKTAAENTDFEHFLEEQVKLLKQHSSDSYSPKETCIWRSSEEKLRRHKSYEETTKNYTDRSSFYKQMSFDTRSSPIEEFPKWTPYQFEEKVNKEDEEIQIDTKAELISSSALNTFEEPVTIDMNLEENPLKKESSEAVVVKETSEWIPCHFEETAKPANSKVSSKSQNVFEENKANEESAIKIDVNLAETPVNEETSKQSIVKQPSVVDLLSVDDTRLEAGRKNSARALKIIQENSLILHRILQHSKSSDKEDSEDELSRSPISKTFKSESLLLSREERTDEERSSRDGDEDLESGTEFSISPAVLEEDNDGYIRKSKEEDSDSYIRKSSEENDSYVRRSKEDNDSYKRRSEDNESYIRKSREEDNDSYIRKSTAEEKNGDYIRKCKEEEDNDSFTRKPSEENDSYIRKSKEDNDSYIQKSGEEEESYVRKSSEDNDGYIRKSTAEKTQDTFLYEYKPRNTNVYEKFSVKPHQIKTDSFSPFSQTKESNKEKQPLELFPFEKRNPNAETKFTFPNEKQFSRLSSDFEENRANNLINDKEIMNEKLTSKSEENNFETLPEISSLYSKKISSTDSTTDANRISSNEKLERYSSWHEEMSSTLSKKQYSSFSFHSENFQKSTEKIKTYDTSQYNLDKHELPSYSARINEETQTNDNAVGLEEDHSISTRVTNDYEATPRVLDEENSDNNVYLTDKSSAQSYSEFQYDKNRLSIDLSSPEISPPKHLSCLQFTAFQTDIPCTSKSLQFSPICVKDKTNLSPTTASPSNTKYSFNLPTLSPPKRSVKSPLSPVKSFNPFPVQPTTRQPKEIGVRLGLYKDLSPLKSPAE